MTQLEEEGNTVDGYLDDVAEGVIIGFIGSITCRNVDTIGVVAVSVLYHINHLPPANLDNNKL